ncbi:multiubiquitin domain-containing protein [Vibrio mytili]
MNLNAIYNFQNMVTTMSIHKEDKPTNIIINGRPKKIEGGSVSYTEVVELAYPGESSSGIVFTVTYMGPQMPDGTLTEGQSVEIRNGVKFNVNKTNRS